MRKNRILALVLAAAMLLTLSVGCGGGKDSTASVSVASQSEESSSEESSVSSEESVPESSSEESSQPESSSEESSSEESSQPEESETDGTGSGEGYVLPEADLKGLTEEECQTYFSDTVFVGDSVMMGFGMYVRDARKTLTDFMEGAQFHVGGSYGSGNALWEVSADSVHPMFRGQQTPVEDALPLMGAKKAVFLFGLNDIGVFGVEGSVENYNTLCDRVLEQSPDLSIVILSATPILSGAEKSVLNNQNIRAYNEALKAMCQERGFEFIDLYTPLSLSDGTLRPEFCSDGFVHETYEAYKVWRVCLMEFAAEKLTAGNAGL